jgi:hypothetical protein
MKGFSDEWRALIHNFVFGVSVTIKVDDDDVDRYFQTGKEIKARQPIITHVI